jgi:hypothetical protein
MCLFFVLYGQRFAGVCAQQNEIKIQRREFGFVIWTKQREERKEFKLVVR